MNTFINCPNCSGLSCGDECDGHILFTPKKVISSQEGPTTDPRFRRAVLAGEYTRAISVYLRIQYPAVEDLSTLPREIRQTAVDAVNEAFFERASVEKALEEEMR